MPYKSSLKSGFISPSSMKNDMAITPIRKAKINSSFRYPICFINKINIVEIIVHKTPIHIFKPNKTFKAYALPNTSCISLPIIAISHIHHNKTDVLRG
jgi:hypothetical protein